MPGVEETAPEFRRQPETFVLLDNLIELPDAQCMNGQGDIFLGFLALMAACWLCDVRRIGASNEKRKTCGHLSASQRY